jgi:hypothetical protein
MNIVINPHLKAFAKEAFFHISLSFHVTFLFRQI